MGLPILYLKGSQVEISKFLSLKIVLILANSVDPDEMQHYAGFHLGLHCLPKYSFRVSGPQFSYCYNKHGTAHPLCS